MIQPNDKMIWGVSYNEYDNNTDQNTYLKDNSDGHMNDFYLLPPDSDSEGRDGEEQSIEM